MLNYEVNGPEQKSETAQAKSGQTKSGNKTTGQINVGFYWAAQMVESDFGIKHVNPWTPLAGRWRNDPFATVVLADIGPFDINEWWFERYSLFVYYCSFTATLHHRLMMNFSRITLRVTKSKWPQTGFMNITVTTSESNTSLGCGTVDQEIGRWTCKNDEPQRKVSTTGADYTSKSWGCFWSKGRPWSSTSVVFLIKRSVSV